MKQLLLPGSLIRANCPAGKAIYLTYYLIWHRNTHNINALQAGIPLASPGKEKRIEGGDNIDIRKIF